MPQGKIKKGFFFYFGLFVLLLIAIFLIILVILMFNPGKTILWFKYFTSSPEPYVITQTTEEDESLRKNIDLSSGSSIETIEIEATYADVLIQKNTGYAEDCIIIENNAKGFATSEQPTEFSYEVLLEGTTLSISVVEPEGFIYLSKNITITINIAYLVDYDESDGNFSNFAFNISTTDGTIDVGGKTYVGQTIAPKALTATTTSGDVILRTSANILRMQGLSFTTQSGEMLTSGNNVTYNGAPASGIVLNEGTINLRTTNGTIDFDVVKINNGGTLNISNDRGNIVIDNLEVDRINVNCYEGNYLIENVICDEFTFTPSEDRIASPNIQIQEMTGDFVISSSNNANPDIIINKLNGSANIQDISGSTSINELDGYVYAIVRNGSLNVTFADQTTSTNNNYLRANGGASISVKFLGAYINNLKVITDNGKINFNLTGEASFTANHFVNDGVNYGDTGTTPESLAPNRISTNIGEVTGSQLIVRGNSSESATINVYTNSNVAYTVS